MARAGRLRESRFDVMAKFSPGEFYRQVRQEVSKVTWATRKETLVTTGVVFLMVVVVAAFFFAVDLTLGHAVRFILGLGA